METIVGPIFEFLQSSGLDTARSVIDILLVTLITYGGLLIIRGTRAAPMLWGLMSISALYFLARLAGLATVTWILQNIFSSLILIVVILFQDEIRRGLTKVGLRQLFKRNEGYAHDTVVEDITLVCERLSQEKLGALIVVQREIGLDEFIEDAVVLDAQTDRKLLYSLFVKGSALHDGAVLIVGDKIRAAGCVLPLSFNPDFDPALGTRHRAALGISERSDAAVVVVSEQNGSVSLVHEGKMTRNLDSALLKDSLLILMSGKRLQRGSAPVTHYAASSIKEGADDDS